MIIDDSCPTSVIVGDWDESLEEIRLSGHTLVLTSRAFSGIVSKSKTLSGLKETGCLTLYSEVQPNPDQAEISSLIEDLSGKEINNIVAIGGGSVIDTAKVLSAFISNSCTISLKEHLEDSHKLDIALEPLYLVSIPTTAGTGSEVTPFATVWDKVEGRKYSIQHNLLYSDVAILDARLLTSMPLNIGISAALDTISHSFEAIWNRHATLVSTRLATKALQLSLRNLSGDVFRFADLEALAKLQIASSYAGVAISRTKTGLAHSISYPLTLKYGISHGVACSFILPSLLEFNSEVDDGRLTKLSSELGFNSIDSLRQKIFDLIESLNVGQILIGMLPSDRSEILKLSPSMIHKGRAENNMRKASILDIEKILEASLTQLCVPR